MKILFDHLGFLHKYGGVPKYYVEVLKRIDPELYILSVLFSNNCYLEESGLKKCLHFFNNYEFKGKYTLLNSLNKLYSIKHILGDKYDIYHQTLYDTYALKYLPKSKIYITTMHDLNFIKIPQYYKAPSFINRYIIGNDILYYQKQSAKKADHIIAISNTTKRDLVEEWNIDPDKITVIYHGVNPPINNLPNERFHERPYILYVGARHSYKNFKNLLLAFKDIKENIDLVCTGNPFNNSEHQFINSLKLDSRIYCYQATELEMARLYKDALCFVYPSFYEGFGMPILEAMSYGCPVVLSETKCFKEIAGDSGLYFNPNSCESIKDSIEKLIIDKELCDELKNMSYTRIKSFDWQITANKHLELYKKLV